MDKFKTVEMNYVAISGSVCKLAEKYTRLRTRTNPSSTAKGTATSRIEDAGADNGNRGNVAIGSN